MEIFSRRSKVQARKREEYYGCMICEEVFENMDAVQKHLKVAHIRQMK